MVDQAGHCDKLNDQPYDSDQIAQVLEGLDSGTANVLLVPAREL